jgi:O-antigen/teichoic acid export membrane protein
MLAFQFAAPFLTLALPSALYFFLPRKPGAERTVLLSNLVALGIMAVIFSTFLLAGGARLLAWRFNNPDLERPLRLLALYPLFALPMGALEACLVAQNQIKRLTIFNVASRALLTVSLIAVCLWTKRPEALVLTQVVLAGVMVVPALMLMWQACSAGQAKLETELMWEMAKYSLPLGLATMLGTMTLQLSSVIVSALCTPAEFAVYSVGAFELPLIGVVTGSITTVILADMSRLCQEQRKDEALRLFQTAALRSAAILFPAMCFFMAAAEPFIVGFYSEKYQGSVLPFRLYLLTLPIRIVTYGAALMALGMTRAILFRSILDFVLNACLCVAFVWLFGYLGGVFAILATLYTWTTAYNLWKIAQGFNVKTATVLPLGPLLRILTLAAIVALPVWAAMNLLELPAFLKLLLACLAYWPATLFLLHRQGNLPIPPFAVAILGSLKQTATRVGAR